jgi:2-acylglycerol O-acyltransferase 2
MDGVLPEFLEGQEWRRLVGKLETPPGTSHRNSCEPGDGEDRPQDAGARALPTRTLAASVLFWIPLVREIAVRTGCVPASRRVADQLLNSRGCNLLVLPGGQQEQIRTECGREKVYVRNRKGFVGLALRHGVPVVPAYAFGASDYYATRAPLGALGLGLRRLVLRALGVALPPLYWGRCGSACCPRPVRTTVVFGRPLDLNRIAAPPLPKDGGTEDCHPLVAEEEDRRRVDAAHAAFVEALVELFEGNKVRLGYGDRTLHVE